MFLNDLIDYFDMYLLLVEQKLSTLPDHLISPSFCFLFLLVCVWGGVSCCLIYSEVCCRPLLVFWGVLFLLIIALPPSSTSNYHSDYSVHYCLIVFEGTAMVIVAISALQDLFQPLVHHLFHCA